MYEVIRHETCPVIGAQIERMCSGLSISSTEGMMFNGGIPRSVLIESLFDAVLPVRDVDFVIIGKQQTEVTALQAYDELGATDRFRLEDYIRPNMESAITLADFTVNQGVVPFGFGLGYYTTDAVDHATKGKIRVTDYVTDRYNGASAYLRRRISSNVPARASILAAVFEKIGLDAGIDLRNIVIDPTDINSFFIGLSIRKALEYDELFAGEPAIDITLSHTTILNELGLLHDTPADYHELLALCRSIQAEHHQLSFQGTAIGDTI